MTISSFLFSLVCFFVGSAVMTPCICLSGGLSGCVWSVGQYVQVHGMQYMCVRGRLQLCISDSIYWCV
ncbi:hypothetical protein HRF25_14010, partial [Enterococcus faecalis]|nr:hypothetical protein [Enterococcus faecalis]